MCQILHHHANATPVSLNVFRELSNANPDGMGLAFLNPDTGKVTTFKTLTDVKRLHKLYVRACEAGLSVIVHWRYTTHGTTSEDNCHPFPLPNGGVLFHNGMLPVEPMNRIKSDTRTFAIDCVRWGVDPFAADPKQRASARRMMAAASHGSRLIALSTTGETWRCGAWVDDASAGYAWANTGCSIAPGGYSRAWTSYGSEDYARWWTREEEKERAPRSAITRDDTTRNVPAPVMALASGDIVTGKRVRLYYAEEQGMPASVYELCDDCAPVYTDAAIVLTPANVSQTYAHLNKERAAKLCCFVCDATTDRKDCWKD